MKFDERFIGGIRRGEITMSARRALNPVTSIEVGHSYVVERWRSDPKDEFGVRLKIRKGSRAGEEISGVWEPTDMRIVIRHLERSLLHALTDDDAKALGFDSAFALFDWWIERHREGCGHRLRGFPDLHVEVPVWLVRFELDVSHRPRLLAARSQHGYTADPREALPEEPEAVSSEVLKSFAAENRARFEGQRGDRQHREEAKKIGRRARELRLRAARQGLDVAAEVRGIERQLDAIEQKLKQRAA